MKKLYFLIYLLFLSDFTFSQTLLDETGDAFLRNSSSTNGWDGTTNLTLRATAAQTSGFKFSYEADSNPRVGRITLNNSWGGIYGDFAISLRNSSGTYERFRILNNSGNVHLFDGLIQLNKTYEDLGNVLNLKTLDNNHYGDFRFDAERTDNQTTRTLLFLDGDNGNMHLLNSNIQFNTTYEDSGNVLTVRTKDNNHFGDFRFEAERSDNGNVRSLMFINGDKRSVGINTEDTGNHELAVEGSIGAREIKVEASGWSDFVFEKDYELRTLEDVEDHINEKGHLPEIPSEAEVTKNGINLGEMDAKLLQKIEELTLYLIEQNKELKSQQDQNQAQQELIEQLQKEVSTLKNK